MNLLTYSVCLFRLVHMTGTDGSHEFKDFLQHVHNFEQVSWHTSFHHLFLRASSCM